MGKLLLISCYYIAGEKISLGLSVFLAFSMFMLLIAEEVPATSESVPLIGKFSFYQNRQGPSVFVTQGSKSNLFFKDEKVARCV